MTFGERLKEVRLERKLTQTELAKRMGLAKPSPISIWECSSAHFPLPATIQKIAIAIGCSTADLMRGVVTPWDLLRGDTSLPDGITTLALTPDDRRLIRALHAMPTAVRDAHTSLLTSTSDMFAKIRSHR